MQEDGPGDIGLKGHCGPRQGRTFSAPRLLRYEDGSDSDEADWGRPGYLERNEIYGSYTAIVTRGGKLLYPFTKKTTTQSAEGPETTAGMQCMIGTWDDGSGDYRTVPDALGRIVGALAEGKCLSLCD
jgi:hypothetical protein